MAPTSLELLSDACARAKGVSAVLASATGHWHHRCFVAGGQRWAKMVSTAGVFGNSEVSLDTVKVARLQKPSFST